jgi:NAD(P)-dependent dehydrogenase (short-subunit alcohol dehydrogenase family)
MGSPRIALVGAGRTRQGLGPFVARDLQAAGAEVVAFCTSRPETVAPTRALLAAQGVACGGFSSLEALLAADLGLEALAILTPPGAHLEGLQAALEHGLHALCEKPLLLAPAAEVEALAAAFEARGLVLVENCQWPCTLDTAWAVLGREPGAPPRTFAMGLTPEGRGRKLLEDALSHPLSLLQGLHGARDGAAAGLRLANARIRPWRAGYTLAWTVEGPHGRTEVEVLLDPAAVSPKPAWYALDGARVDRRIDSASYRMSLEGPERSLPLPDPLTQHIASVTATLAATLSGAAPPPSTGALVERARLLAQLLATFDAGLP